MNNIRKPICDYIEFDFLTGWSNDTQSAFDNLKGELKGHSDLDNFKDIETTILDVIANVYIEAFHDGYEFCRWLNNPSCWFSNSLK